MVSEMRVHAAANVVELSVQILVALQTTPIIDPELVTWLHDLLKPRGTWGHETARLSVKGDIEDVSSELDIGVKGCTSWMKHPELYCSRRVRI
ncbi:hypothetical protein TNCV_4832151 [Trichonephila clavipes]|nr:hypothetical protein TNCV_4832151 [Trichonephila clavipes]